MRSTAFVSTKLACLHSDEYRSRTHAHTQEVFWLLPGHWKNSKRVFWWITFVIYKRSVLSHCYYELFSNDDGQKCCLRWNFSLFRWWLGLHNRKWKIGLFYRQQETGWNSIAREMGFSFCLSILNQQKITTNRECFCFTLSRLKLLFVRVIFNCPSFSYGCPRNQRTSTSQYFLFPR